MKAKLKLNTGNVALDVLIAFLFFIVVLGISFLLTSGVLWVVNWAFGLSFWSWKTCFGIWLALSLLSASVKLTVNTE